MTGADATFLTDAEVVRLTGSPRRTRQTEWLADHGYEFEINAAGRPIVLRSVVLARLGQKSEKKKEPAPRWEALRSGSPSEA